MKFHGGPQIASEEGAERDVREARGLDGAAGSERLPNAQRSRLCGLVGRAAWLGDLDQVLQTVRDGEAIGGALLADRDRPSECGLSLGESSRSRQGLPLVSPELGLDVGAIRGARLSNGDVKRLDRRIDAIARGLLPGRAQPDPGGAEMVARQRRARPRVCATSRNPSRSRRLRSGVRPLRRSSGDCPRSEGRVSTTHEVRQGSVAVASFPRRRYSSEIVLARGD